MKQIILTTTCIFSAPLASHAAISWTPNAASPSGHFGTDMPDNSVINYGTFTDDTGTAYDYEVVFKDMQQFLRDASGNDAGSSIVPTDLSSDRNQFEVVGGLADLNTFFNSNSSHDPGILKPPYANGPSSFIEICVNFFDSGSYIAGAAQLGVPAGATALQVGSGTAAAVNFGVSSPNHTNFTRLNNIEEFGVDWGGSGAAVFSDPYNQIDTTSVDPFTGADLAFAVEAPGFGNDLDANTHLAPTEANYNIILPASSSFSFTRSDSDSSRATGTNSALGFTSNAPVVPEPSSTILLATAFITALSRRKK